MNNPIFTSRVTDDVPPKLIVNFGDSPFTKEGIDCYRLVVKAERQITVHLGNKTVVNEAAGNLIHAHDCGKYLSFRQASQNTYTYASNNEEGTLGNLSQVILQVRGSNLVAQFEAGGAAAPVAPMMPGSQVPAPVGQGTGVVSAPAAVTPVAVAAAQPPVTPLKGNVPQESWRLNRLVGTSYDDYLWYVSHPNPPTDPQKKAAYDRQYPIFLREEELYATLQEKLTAAKAHNRLTSLPSNTVAANIFTGEDVFHYDTLRQMFSQPQNYSHDQLKDSPVYPRVLQAERDYLAQQARNEYHSAS